MSPRGRGTFGTTPVLCVAFPQSWSGLELHATCVSCNALLGACCHSESFTQQMSGTGEVRWAHLFSLGKAPVPSLSSSNADLGTACSGMVI